MNDSRSTKRERREGWHQIVEKEDGHRTLRWSGPRERPLTFDVRRLEGISMNRWNIPKYMEEQIRVRDTKCIYCGTVFRGASSKKEMPSWEHIVNDATIVTLENIALCCIGCNASKGAKDLSVWLSSSYCQKKGITRESIGAVARNALAASER